MLDKNIYVVTDEQGRLFEHTTIVSKDDGASLGECWKRYDVNGNLIYEKYSTNVVKTYRYDNEGNLVDSYDPAIQGAINAIRLYTDYSEGYDIKAELAFAFGGSTTISWITPTEREVYEPGINGYTLFFDEREKAPFEKQRRPLFN